MAQQDTPELAYSERLAGNYHAIHERPVQRLRTRIEAPMVLRDVLDDQDVAVVGSGGGRELEYLARRRVRLVCVDFSPSMLEQARVFVEQLRARADFRARSVEFVSADVGSLPFGDEAFDRVLCLGVLGVVPHYARAMHELARVTRTGGAVLVEVMNETGFKERMERRAAAAHQRPTPADAPFRKLFSPAELTDLLRSVGLEGVCIRRLLVTADFVPTAWNSQAELYPRAERALALLGPLDRLLARVPAVRRGARFLLATGRR